MLTRAVHPKRDLVAWQTTGDSLAPRPRSGLSQSEGALQLSEPNFSENLPAGHPDGGLQVPEGRLAGASGAAYECWLVVEK